MIIFKLAYLFLLFLLVRFVIRMFFKRPKKSGPKPNADIRGKQSAPFRPTDLNQQDISDADYEEIP